MKRVTLIIFALPFFSCNNSNNAPALIRIDKNLQSSSTIIRQYNEEIYLKLKEKINNVIYHEKATFWFPKADRLKTYSLNMLDWIDSTKASFIKNTGVTSNIPLIEQKYLESAASLVEKENLPGSIFNRLRQYKGQLISVIQPDSFSNNPSLQENLAAFAGKLNSSPWPEIRFDSINNVFPTFNYFKNESVLEVLIEFDKIKMDVLNAENSMLTFLDGQVSAIIENYTTFSAIAVKNSNYLKTGDTLEILAGIGEFSRLPGLKINIDNKNISLIDGSVAEFKNKINKKPGKFSIPVTIEFLDRYGHKMIKDERIVYTVIQ